jgi:ASC-1-like (ASCH) protein
MKYLIHCRPSAAHHALATLRALGAGAFLKGSGVTRAQQTRQTQCMEIHVQQPWLTYLQTGQKVVEGRLNKGKFADLKVGDVVIITGDAGSHADCRRTVACVSHIARYRTFEAYLNEEGLSRTLPGIHSVQEGVSVYRQFYTADEERQHGVLAIHLTLACNQT